MTNYCIYMNTDVQFFVFLLDFSLVFQNIVNVATCDKCVFKTKMARLSGRIGKVVHHGLKRSPDLL